MNNEMIPGYGEMRSRFAALSPERRLELLMYMESFVENALAPNRATSAAEDVTPTLDRDVWGEIEELL